MGQVKMLTPPGPTRRPTTMSTTPQITCFRMIAKIPAITRMTATIHNTVASVTMVSLLLSRDAGADAFTQHPPDPRGEFGPGQSWRHPLGCPGDAECLVVAR